MVKRSLACLSGLAALAAVTALLLSPAAPGWAAPQAAKPAAKPAEPLQVQETNEVGVMAEFIECKRKEGVLTVKVRFRNTGTAPAAFYVIVRGNYDDLYVTAEDKKYFVLRDEERTPLSPTVDPGGGVHVSLKPGGTWLWWAKYPAPPSEVKKINYIWTLGAPFEDIPITDQ